MISLLLANNNQQITHSSRLDPQRNTVIYSSFSGWLVYFIYFFFSNIGEVTQPCCAIDEYSSTWTHVLIDVLMKDEAPPAYQNPPGTAAHVIWFTFIAFTHAHNFLSDIQGHVHARPSFPNVTLSLAFIKADRRMLSDVVTWPDLSLCWGVC